MTHDDIVAANPIAEFVRNRGHELKRAGENFVTNACPKIGQHKPGHRPVTIYPGSNSWYDHDCKIGGTVIDWVMQEKGCDAVEAMRILGGGRNGEVKKSRRRIVATYDYTDEHGKLVFQVVRYASKKFLQRRPADKGGWIWKVKGVRGVLFRLHHVVKDVQRGLPIYVCAGEKDALAMVEHGFGATTKAGGEGNWLDDFSETLRGADVIIIADKDEKGRDYAQTVASKLHGVANCVRVIELPDVNGTPVKDPADFFAAGGNADQLQKVTDSAPEWMPDATTQKASDVEISERPLIEFRSPLQLKNFTPPPGLVLVGDHHIVKGSVFVEAGPPGVGKSRGSVALAEAGATGHKWFGLTIHRKFKTMIVQTENGEFRLAREFGELDCDALEPFVRICTPPPYGLCFSRDDFRQQLRAEIAEFAPDIVIFDPWNAAARDDRQREYLETFEDLKSVLPLGDDAPALGIVAHTRKPKTDERASGRALLNLLAGSYVLGSVPRTVFVMPTGER